MMTHAIAKPDKNLHNRLKAPLFGLCAIAAILWSSPAQAAAFLTTETVVYEWSEEVDAAPQSLETANQLPTGNSDALATYGPFRVINPQKVELRGDIGPDAPRQFRAMLADYPGIGQIDFIDCPGTVDDTANLALARMIRRAGIATHVPAGGFVGSGGVELFLAGAHRSAHPDAEFAVHSWIDEDGMQADDFAMNDPVHQSYLAYYREMGMSADKALAFYQMTNSVPHEDALYLRPRDIAAYIPVN